MNIKTRTIKYFLSSAILFSLIASPVFAADFNPNNIISDAEMLDATSMNQEEIEQFLKSQGGFISNWSTKNSDGYTHTAAQIIYEAANNYDCSEAVNLSNNPTRQEKARKCTPITINPKMLITLLQKEQSLITEKSPKQTQLDWAVGYGCPDGDKCNTRWEGFGKQVNSASLQFYDYVKNPTHYKYQKNNTYTFTNTAHPDSVVTPLNNATAALYNYTPHVYWGNYNFYNLWNKFFSRAIPNGSLVQVKGEPGVWLIQNGKKRPFTTKGALTSRFDTNMIIQINASDLNSYSKGDPIRFAQYSLIRSPRGTIYLLVNDAKRKIINGEAFRQIGFNPEEVVDASWSDINSYNDGTPITETTTYATGSLLQDKISGGIYYVEDGKKAPLWDAVLLKTKFKNRAIVPIEPIKLLNYTTIEPVKFDDGALITPNNSPAVYVIENGKKRPITSGKVFEDMGYKWDNIIITSPKIINLYEKGENLTITKAI